MRDMCELQEALDSIAEMKDSEISINPNFIREAANEARAYLGYYRGAKQTVRRLRGSIKKLEAQLETTRHQLEQAKQQRDEACLKNKTIELEHLYTGDFMVYPPPLPRICEATIEVACPYKVPQEECVARNGEGSCRHE